MWSTMDPAGPCMAYSLGMELGHTIQTWIGDGGVTDMLIG